MSARPRAFSRAQACDGRHATAGGLVRSTRPARTRNPRPSREGGQARRGRRSRNPARASLRTCSFSLMASLKSASSGASRRASASSRCERRRWRSAVRRRSRSASSGADAGSAMLARPLPSSASLCRPRLGFSCLHAPLTHSGLRSPAPAPAPATGLVRAATSTQLGRQLKATRAPPGRGVGCGGVRRCCGGLWHTSRRERTARARSAAHARGSDTRVLAAKASASPESHGAGSGVNARARPGREGCGPAAAQRRTRSG